MEEQMKLLASPSFEASEGQRKEKKRKPFIVGIVIATVFGIGALYAWQNSASDVSIGELAQDFQFSDANFDEIFSDANQSSLSALAATDDSSGFGVGSEDESKLLLLIAPNGGETFCLGEQLDIQWEHVGVERIQFSLYREGEDAVHNIGMFSAGFEKDQQLDEEVYVQEVKEGNVFVSEEGSDYKVKIFDEDDPSLVDISDNVFSIKDCASS